MMKHLLSGTAVALMLVANPALAQDADDEAPESEVEEEMELDESETDDQEAVEPDAPEDDDDVADEPRDDPDTAEEPLGDEDTAGDEPAADEDVAERPSETFFAEQEDEEVLASELMGVNVENPDGETLGSIEDVIVDEEIGVKGIVVGVGGFLGLGQKLVAVNYDEIEHVRGDEGEVTLTFSGTTEALEEAPEFRTLQQQIADAEAEQMEQQQTE